MRYPLLHALRADRQRREAELAAPHIARAERAMRIAAEERRAREGLERAMASKLAPMILEDIAHAMSSALQHEIMKAASAALKTQPTTTIEVPTGMLLYGDRNSIVSNVIDWWKQTTAPKMRLRAITDIDAPMSSSYTRVRLSIPELHYEHAVMNDF